MRRLGLGSAAPGKPAAAPYRSSATIEIAPQGHSSAQTPQPLQ